MNISERLNAIKIPASSTIRDAMEAIDKGALGLALLIEIEDETFCGLITDGDLRRALLQGNGLESKVDEIPRAEPVIANKKSSLTELASIANHHKHVSCVPLLNSQNQVVDLAIFDRKMPLPVAEPIIGNKELENVIDCIVTGWVSSTGKYVSEFEEKFAEFCNSRYAISSSNGTTALHLALLALGIGTGDEVIVPSLTFISTANAVKYTGAHPIFVDSDPETWNIDPNQIESAITDRTKAIIPVHLYGHPADMDPIMEIAEYNELAIIEDAAEAHGATYKGRQIGAIGDMGCFSFYGNKIITTGEGGMVVTNDSDFAERMKIFRDHGMSPNRRYWHTVLGFNYRMTNLQAALGVAQLERIESILARKRQIASNYQKELTNIPGISLPPNFSWAENVYWLYSVLIDESCYGLSRDELISVLKNEGIETRPVFPPIHTQPIYANGQHLPVAEQLSYQGLSSPSGLNLRLEDISRLAKIVRDKRHVEDQK